jgi:hypothetical protein
MKNIIRPPGSAGAHLFVGHKALESALKFKGYDSLVTCNLFFANLSYFECLMGAVDCLLAAKRFTVGVAPSFAQQVLRLSSGFR